LANGCRAIDGPWPRRAPALRRLLEALNFAPGTEISYSNTGYRLIQAALEAKSSDYATVLREVFLEPLGLRIAFPNDQTEPVARLAAGYWRSEKGWRQGRYGAYFSASGGLAGSARDLASWAQALLANRGPAAGLLAKLGAPRQLLDGRATNYGLGLARYEIAGEVMLGHGGSLPGYKNHFLVSPANRVGVVVLSNREETDAQDLALAIMARLFGGTLVNAIAQDLPTGRFVAEREPLWLEHQPGTVIFLGAQQNVFRAGKTGAAGRSAELPIRLQADGDELTAEIGHVSRRFRRAAEGALPDRGWAGRWVCPTQRAEFDIDVSAGLASLRTGIGPTHATFPLSPIAPNLALMERVEGPWRQRLCLDFASDAVALITNRSRVLRFRRG
jgi:hypothetical protein